MWLRLVRHLQCLLLLLAGATPLVAAPILSGGKPVTLDVRQAGAGCVRLTLRPEGFASEFPESPVLPQRDYPEPVLRLTELTQPMRAEVAGLVVEVLPQPLRITVTRKDGTPVQSLTVREDGVVAFALDDARRPTRTPEARRIRRLHRRRAL